MLNTFEPTFILHCVRIEIGNRAVRARRAVTDMVDALLDGKTKEGAELLKESLHQAFFARALLDFLEFHGKEATTTEDLLGRLIVHAYPERIDAKFEAWWAATEFNNADKDITDVSRAMQCITKPGCNMNANDLLKWRALSTEEQVEHLKKFRDLFR